MTAFTYPSLSAWRKKQLLNYAQQVLTQQQQMIGPDGQTILHYVLENTHKPVRNKHYPKGDRIDKNTGAQYFYHCHRENYDTNEHGHFHCFVRYPHISKRIHPKPLPDWDKYIKNPMTHLVGIAINCLGQPIRLFTTNRWVTSEIWYDAKHSPRLLRHFKMTKEDEPYWKKLDQWIEGMLHLFTPQIAWLHQMRDQAILLHQKNNPDDHVYENKALSELSSIPIDLTQQIQWILQTTI